MKSRITIGHFPIIDHLILGVAAHNDGGSFTHFDLKTQLFYNWQKMADALKNDKIDGTFIIFPLAMELFREGVDIKLLLLGQREGAILMLKKDIKNIKDLKGKTILIPHKYSVHNILLHQLFKREGLDPDKDVFYKMNFEDVRELGTAIGEGKVQAVCTTEPWGVIAEKSGSARVMQISPDLKMHHVCCVLVLKNKVITRQPEACEELIRSLVRAGMFVSAYPRQASEIGEKFINCSKKMILEALTHGRGRMLTWDLLPRLEDFEDLEKIAIEEMHLWPKPIDLTNFIEPRFAQEAYREWMIDTRREVKDRGVSRSLPGNFAEAVSRWKNYLGSNATVFGLKILKRGDKYPSEVKRISLPKTSAQDLLKQVLLSGSLIIDKPRPETKALFFFKEGTEPDLVWVKLSSAWIAQVQKVLTWGGITQELKPSPNFNDLLFSDKLSMTQVGENTWLAIPYEIFKVFPVLLKNNEIS